MDTSWPWVETGWSREGKRPSEMGQKKRHLHSRDQKSQEEERQLQWNINIKKMN